jgi:hypothetical protein
VRVVAAVMFYEVRPSIIGIVSSVEDAIKMGAEFIANRMPFLFKTL